MSDCLQPCQLQHARLPCPPPSTGVCSNSPILSWWYHPAMSSSVAPFLAWYLSHHEVIFQWASSCISWSKHWSFIICPSDEYSQLISFRIDWFDLIAVQGTLKEPWRVLDSQESNTTNSKASILQYWAFFMVQFSHPNMTTEKTIALTRWTFVGKVTPLLFNTLSRLVIAFVPRSRQLLISRLQSPSAVILEPKKMSLSLCPLFPHLFAMQWWVGCHDCQFPLFEKSAFRDNVLTYIVWKKIFGVVKEKNFEGFN